MTREAFKPDDGTCSRSDAPASLKREAHRQLCENRAALYKGLAVNQELIEKLMADGAIENPLEFDLRESSPKGKRALRAVMALEASAPHVGREVLSLRLRPYPSKQRWAWRVEMGFGNDGGFGGGVEYYVDYEAFFRAWEVEEEKESFE